MIELTEEQKNLLESYKIPLSSLFDATGLRKKEYHDIMKNLDKFIAIGVTPCKAYGHTIRTRNGHCLQCKPESITFFNRYYKDSTVYIAASKIHKVIKVGYTKDIREREHSLRNTKYAGINDWKIVYYTKCKNAGKIEFEIQNRLKEYYYPSEYELRGKNIACYEVFSCSFNKAKEKIKEIKNKYPNEIVNKEIEMVNAELIFNFENRKNTDVTRRGNIYTNDEEKINSQYTNRATRRSEFIDELNQISNPESLDYEIRDMKRKKNNNIDNDNKVEKNVELTETQIPDAEIEKTGIEQKQSSIAKNIFETKPEIKVTQQKSKKSYVILWIIFSIILACILIQLIQ